MTMWRYIAVPVEAPESAARVVGELAGDSAADARASLRRIGLQVVRIAPGGALRKRNPSQSTAVRQIIAGWTAKRNSHLRARRRIQKAELYDSIATMLASGMPLLEAVEALIGSSHRKRRWRAAASVRTMLSQVREALRGGDSLAEAMTAHPGWFDAAEVAMVRSGQHGGTLTEVLVRLAQRNEHAGQITTRLINALAYPCLLVLAGLAVVVFLSVRTLPQLTTMLAESDIPVPALTASMMNFGQTLYRHGLLLCFGSAFLCGGAMTLRMGLSASAARVSHVPLWLRRLKPLVARRLAMASVLRQVSELLAANVPLVEALRVIAPSARSRTLQHALRQGADRVERGESFSQALDDELWFEPPLRRTLELGERSGDLDQLMRRIADRYERSASRLIDRLAALLEPAAIVGLAIFVGIVVMAGILPLIRLQEVLR